VTAPESNPSAPEDDTETMPDEVREEVSAARAAKPYYATWPSGNTVRWLASDRERLQAALTAAEEERTQLVGKLDRIAHDIHAYADTLMIPNAHDRYFATRESKEVRTFATQIEDAAMAAPIPDSEGGA